MVTVILNLPAYWPGEWVCWVLPGGKVLPQLTSLVGMLQRG